MRGREINGSLGGPSTDDCTVRDLEHRLDIDVAEFVEECQEVKNKQSRQRPMHCFSRSCLYNHIDNYTLSIFNYISTLTKIDSAATTIYIRQDEEGLGE